MSLVNLRTSLKDLKYKGFSGRGLYVENNINTAEVKTGLSIIDQIDKRGDDATRLFKLFTDRPGIKFISNLGLLSLAENQKKIGQGGGVAALKNVAATLPILLGQAVVNGTGVHLSVDDTTGNTYLRGANTGLLGKEVFTTPFDESKLTRKLKDQKTTINPVTPDQTLVTSPPPTKDNDFEIKYKLKTGTTRVDTVNYLKVNSTELSEYKDLIDFKFVILEPGQPTPFTLVFRSYLESLDDSFNGSWDETRYIGRAEPLYNYTGFSRNIGFSFKIAAASELELLPLYQKLNYLVGSTAPSYSSVFMRGVLTRVTIGDYLKNVPGFFTQINLNWNTTYPWEIQEGKNQNLNAPNVPHILDVRTSFTPIHTFTPEFKTPFITDQEFLNKAEEHVTLAEYV